MIGDIALTLFFVFLNAFFVAAEFAIVKVRASQIELRAREGNMVAGIARHILNNLDAYLSASQLGITIASLVLGSIGEPVVAAITGNLIEALHIDIAPEIMHKVNFILALSIITILHIVLGEQAPKTFAIKRSELVTLAVALPLRVFFIVFKPVIYALNAMSHGLLRLLGMQPSSEHEVHSPEEIRYLIQESTEQGALEMSERELIENVFEFTETTAGQVMVPRARITGIDLSMNTNDMLDKVMYEGYSRLPVYRNTIDDIVGIVYAKDLLTLMHNKHLIIIQDIVRPAYFVTEDTKLKKLLREMQQRKILVAVVLDEFGGTAGLVTLEDILEELVGSIQDEYDDEHPDVIHRQKNVYELVASLHIDEVNDIIQHPLPESEDYETLGGMINARAGRIPASGDVIDLDMYWCTILEAGPRRVERVKLTIKNP